MAKAKVKEETSETVDVPEQNGATEFQPEGINLTDLATLRQIVDIATQRGAFKGAELSQVGGVYDKLNVFLNYVEEQQKAAQAALPKESE